MIPVVAAIVSTLINKGMENVNNLRSGSSRQSQISPSDVMRMIPKSVTSDNGSTDINANKSTIHSSSPNVNYEE